MKKSIGVLLTVILLAASVMPVFAERETAQPGYVAVGAAPAVPSAVTPGIPYRADLKETVIEAFRKAKEGAERAVRDIGAWFNSIDWAGYGAAVSRFFRNVGNTLSGYAVTAANWARETATEVWNGARRVADTATEAVKGFFARTGDFFHSLIGG